MKSEVFNSGLPREIKDGCPGLGTFLKNLLENMKIILFVVMCVSKISFGGGSHLGWCPAC